ncbi:hypothetical protein BGZ61DRAFT_536867 [Ilyonectria robusta]|uniref:uncharacterized protein n=1 Tax=Ilyonectria robusta TaxID=1079257 RepID=UPI001E8CF886|nr:uncharacterized protein BGZ61DRAFT_536867 [Ilyonectria robusta]KAH8672215.1 hypothetical protein BGZ61DRAFT_536867 [Ilyonectria robusta]
MAEIVGVVASVVALSKCCVGAFKAVDDIRQAPALFQNLQEEAHLFQEVLREVNNAVGDSPIGAVHEILLKAQKGNIAAIRDELKDVRVNLLIALSMQSMLRPAEFTAATSETAKPRSHFRSTSGESSVQAPPIERLRRTLETLDVDDGDILVEAEVKQSEEEQPQVDFHRVKDLKTSQALRKASPLTSLEKSMSFRPETLACADTATLFSHMTIQASITNMTRTNLYDMFYCKTPRQWIRLRVSVTFSVESRFWNYESAPACTGTKKELPPNVGQILKGFLKSRVNLQQDTHLQIHSGSQVQIVKSTFQPTAYFKTITNMLRHLNCPRFSEDLLLQVPLHRRERSFFFVSRLPSQWTLDFRFGSERSLNDVLLYQLQALHCLRGAPGMSPFLGLVTDQDTALVKGFLCELPATGLLFKTVMAEATNSGVPISWDRRERWCRDIIRAVAEAHSKGFLIGKLGWPMGSGIAVDGQDRAVLFHFQPVFFYQKHQRGRLPPECKNLGAADGFFTANPTTDIFQLGLTIWHIAANVHSPTPSQFCDLTGCVGKMNTLCTEPHADPVQLPPLPGIPQYLTDVIYSCRVEKPHQRSAAWELLKMFPLEAEICATPGGLGGPVVGTPLGEKVPSGGSPASCSSRTIQDQNTHEHPKELICHLEEVQKLYDNSSICDICKRLTTDRSFQCIICSVTSYDICPQCFSKGVHCLEPRHYLTEQGSQVFKERLFSNVKENGTREIIVL